jgi:hypothetical protein
MHRASFKGERNKGRAQPQRSRRLHSWLSRHHTQLTQHVSAMPGGSAGGRRGADEPPVLSLLLVGLHTAPCSSSDGCAARMRASQASSFSTNAVRPPQLRAAQTGESEPTPITNSDGLCLAALSVPSAADTAAAWAVLSSSEPRVAGACNKLNQRVSQLDCCCCPSASSCTAATAVSAAVATHANSGHVTHRI